MKKILFVLFTLLIIAGCGKDNETEQSGKSKTDITGISLDRKEITLKAGESYQFQVNYTPSEAQAPQYNWSITDEKYYHMTKSTNQGSHISSEGKLTVYSGGSIVVHVGAYSDNDIFFDDECKVNIIPSIDEFYTWHCFGFMIKDTTGILSGKNVYFKPQTSQKDTTYLVGIKNDKIWIGTFNTNTKEQLNEWTDTETISRTQKAHIGYGKYEEFTINHAEVRSFIKNGENVIMELVLENDEKSNTHNFTMLSFRNKGITKRYFVTNTSNQPLIKWHDNSYLFNIDARKEPYVQGDYYTCFDEGGNIIITGKMFQWHNAEMLFPINFDEYLYFDYGYKSIHISKKSISSGDNLWVKILVDDFDTDSKFTPSLISRKDNIFRFKIDVTEYSGNKYSVIYDINIINGSFQKISN